MEIKTATATDIGSFHILKQLPCQDNVFSLSNDKVTCIALADGAGSVEHSEIISDAIVKHICTEFTDRFDYWYSMEQDIFAKELIDSCTDAAREHDIVRDLACTMLGYAVAEDGRCIWCHIGDGVIIGVKDDDNVEIISEPENGADSSETFFISGPDPEKHMHFGRESSNLYNTVIMVSDGIQKSLWNKNSGDFANAVPRIASWMDNYPAGVVSKRLKDELDESFRQKTEDDMSIAVLSVID